jgi:predicted phosphoadenosine phosphosulfate sulfurtransferase
MSSLKQYTDVDVLTAARARVNYAFDNFERVYVSFSGGKDSSVMFHVTAQEAKRRGRRFGVLIIDLEAQYKLTIDHINTMCDYYADIIDVYWVCLPMLLRNAVSSFEPRWCCWDPDAKDIWVRNPPKRAGVITDPAFFPFFESKMEFEEFMVLFGEWYGGDKDAIALVGIRADESLNRFRTVASADKEMHNGHRWTTKVEDGIYNLYPLYDWKTQDLWKFHAVYPELPHNEVYDRMHLAGLTIHQMRLCQPYGDDQRRGLWLYHIIEPETWSLVVNRVQGANSGSLYIQETGNINGYNRITKPAGHTWKSYCNLLLSTMPTITQKHYREIFTDWIARWKGRGYTSIPDEAPRELENKKWAPSWRRLCKCLLRNDWWCKGLGLTQPKSDAYGRYLDIKKARKASLCAS